MSREKYIPLDQLDPELCDWQCSLPPSVEPSQIGINAPRLCAMKYLSGIALLTVTAHQGKVSHIIPQIGSINPDSTANVGATNAVVRAKRNLISSHIVGPDYGPNYARTHHVISINKPEMASKIADIQHQKELEPAEVWSAQLDSELRHGFRAVIKEELTDRRIFFGYAITAITAYFSSVNFIAKPVAEAVVETIKISGYFIAGELAAKATKGGKDAVKRRLPSVLPGVQFDRYAVVAGASLLPGLIRPIKTTLK